MPDTLIERKPRVHRSRVPVALAAGVALGLSASPAAAQQSADGPAPAAGPERSSAAPRAVAGPPAPPIVLTRAQVTRVQRVIDVRADGALGAGTRVALKRWERRVGLPADGRPDAEGLRRMGISLTRGQTARATSRRSALSAEPAADGPGVHRQAVEAAMGQAGTPYRSAGARPGGFDCSGLTMWAFAKVGIELPHSSFAQFELGTAVDKDEIRAGDLVFFDSAGPGASDVGIATGPTTVVSATTHGVRKHATFDAYWGGHYVGARRLPRS